MWREATTIDRRWPPTWLVAVVALMLILLALHAVGAFIEGFFSVAGSHIAQMGFESDLSVRVRELFASYFDDVAPLLGFSGDSVGYFWLIAGGVLLLASATGSLGGRVGWTVYGTATCLLGAQLNSAARPLAVSATAVSWSLLSLLAFRRREESKKRRKAFLELASEYLERRQLDVEERARIRSAKLDYAGVREYFDDNGHNPAKARKDLRMSSSEVERLRSKYVPEGFPKNGKISPRQRRDIFDRYESREMGKPELAAEFEVTTQTITKWINAERKCRNSLSDAR
jgi:hypothetical protein